MNGGRRPGLVNFKWLLILLYLIALITGTHLPEDSLAVETAIHWAGNDKLAHFFGYCGLSTLVFLVLGQRRDWWTAAITMALLALLGILDEWSQPWFDRSAELSDWFGDVAGIFLGWLMAGLLIKIANKK